MRIAGRYGGLWSDQRGSQILELAISLPLIVVFVVGIFDFGGAFNLKQKLNGITRESARLGASLPTNDLTMTSNTPGTVLAMRTLVSDALTAAQINHCGLLTTSGSASGGLTWTFTVSGNGCVGSMTLTIERGFSFPATINGQTVDVLSTRVTLSYPYQWRFGNVIKLLVPGASYAAIAQIQANAIVPNQD